MKLLEIFLPSNSKPCYKIWVPGTRGSREGERMLEAGSRPSYSK